jgi:putative membrane protein
VRTRTRSIAKGAIAGLLGGIAATAAKSAVEKIYPPRTHREPEPPAILTHKLGGRELTVQQKGAALETMHWGFGAAVGAAYGAVAEFYPPATSKQGASFGMALVALSHDSTLPILGLAAKPEAQTKRERTSELASYIAYGVVTETVRRIVRRMID